MKSAGNAASARIGRPSNYCEELADAICDRLAQGEGLNDICQDEDMPSERTVREWVLSDRDGFSPKYMRARDLGIDVRADGLRNLAKSAVGLDNAGVQAIRLVVDTEKWYLSKIAPKRYGDKIDVEVDDKRPLTPEARQARITELLALAGVKGTAEAPPTRDDPVA